MYKEPHFDLLYGFRGAQDSVDLLSPYEMLLHYSIERILPPTNTRAQSRAAWTDEGKKHVDECRKSRMRGHYVPGGHYTAIEGSARIMLPNLRDCVGYGIVGVGKRGLVLIFRRGPLRQFRGCCSPLNKMIAFSPYT